MSESQLEKSEIQTPSNTTKNVAHPSDDDGDSQLEKLEIQTLNNNTKIVAHSSNDDGDCCSSYSELKTDALPPFKPNEEKMVSSYEKNINNNKDATHLLEQEVSYIAISANHRIMGLRCKNLQIGSHNTMNIGTDGNKETIKKKRIDEKQLKIYLDSPRILSKNDLFVIANNLGCEWRAVGRYLGLEDAELDAVKHDFDKEGLKEICYQMLKLWFEKNPSQCIVGTLAKALLESEKDDLILQLPHDK